MTSASVANGDLSTVFSVQGRGGISTGPDQENRVGDQDTGSPGRPGSSGCKCAVRLRIVMQEQESLGEFPAAIFLQNVLQLHQQR